MRIHSHTFVETYDGLMGFGADRKTDESTAICYLQKFCDDTLMEHLMPRLSDDELSEVFDMITRLLKKHLTNEEYHRLFLKDDH